MCSILTRFGDRFWVDVEKAPTVALLVARALFTMPAISIEAIVSSIFDSYLWRGCLGRWEWS